MRCRPYKDNPSLFECKAMSYNFDLHQKTRWAHPHQRCPVFVRMAASWPGSRHRSGWPSKVRCLSWGRRTGSTRSGWIENLPNHFSKSARHWGTKGIGRSGRCVGCAAEVPGVCADMYSVERQLNIRLSSGSSASWSRSAFDAGQNPQKSEF